MAITVRFFARLREELDIDETQIEAESGITPLMVWQKVTGKSELPAQTLVAVNQEYADADLVINDKDEVAFFPPVTGG